MPFLTEYTEEDTLLLKIRSSSTSNAGANDCGLEMRLCSLLRLALMTRMLSKIAIAGISFLVLAGCVQNVWRLAARAPHVDVTPSPPALRLITSYGDNVPPTRNNAVGI
jgi:hypothetical protein